MQKISSQWLEETNAEFKQQGIIDGEQKIRAAISKWRNENRENIERMLKDENLDREMLRQQIDSQDMKIKAFFLTKSSKDRGYIYPPFVGIYYYQGYFWEIIVPFIMGMRGINFFECLRMSDEFRRQLYSDEDSIDEYILVCADSIDYGYGIMEVESKCNSDFSKELFRSADKHLRATISLLNQEKASSKAVEDARMSVEIFLKAYLTVKENLTDNDLRRQIGHNLETAIDRCITNGLNELTPLRNKFHLLPEVQSRYEAPELTFGELWNAYRLAHVTGTTILRNLTGRDCRNTIKRNS